MDVLRVLLDAVQATIGLVFLFSAFGKLRDPRGFVRGVIAYQVLPQRLAIGYGLLLVPLEVALALSMLSDRFVRTGAVLALLLLTSFLLAVGLNVRRGRALSCFCFGAAAGEQVSGRSLARIVLLLTATVLVFCRGWGWRFLPEPSGAVYDGRWLIDGFLLLTLAVGLLAGGAWLLALPDASRSWWRAGWRSG